MKAHLHIKEFIQPFERELALSELCALSSLNVKAVNGNRNTASIFEVKGNFDPSHLCRVLSYWHSVETDKPMLTDQIRVEATSVLASNGFDIDTVCKRTPELVRDHLPNRRCLRYASHGIHEYRGKFFPQLVRALININEVPKGGVVLDPMCGSGTTLVEAKASGHEALGLDMNPLSAFISNVKCGSLYIDPRQLIRGFDRVRELSNARIAKGSKSYWLETLSDNDRQYLESWFSHKCLMDISQMQFALNSIKNKNVRNYFTVCLSNVLRGVSYQKEEDLRTRREDKEYVAGCLQDRFGDFSHRSVKLLVSYLAERKGRIQLMPHTVISGDARDFVERGDIKSESVDSIITSPPYATALPYLDTDRLSLIILGLLPREEHRNHDKKMIGNREINNNARTEYWEYFCQNQKQLPKSTVKLLTRIHRLNNGGDVGFRRKNLAALLAKYFFDMRRFFENSQQSLKKGAQMSLVVGNNHTKAGGKDVQIRTAENLAKIAQDLDFEYIGSTDMNMLTSRDIFGANAIPSEQIIQLRKP